MTAVVKERREGNETPFTMPDLCPICASPLEKPEGEVVWRCPNLSCPARLRESLLHFVSRDAMNIDGFGEALVDQLLEKGMVKDPAEAERVAAYIRSGDPALAVSLLVLAKRSSLARRSRLAKSSPRPSFSTAPNSA